MAKFNIFKQKQDTDKGGTTIFFCSDLHGSTSTFKKFINAGTYYKAKGHPVDILLMGGDMTGKMIVPIIRRGNIYESYLTGMNFKITTDDDLSSFEKKCETLGVYSYIFDPEEYELFKADAKTQEELFKSLMIKRLEEWIDFAENRLSDQDIKCYMGPGNDDIFEIDKVLARAKSIVNPDDEVIQLDPDHEIVSFGYSNITPFGCPRDIPEEEVEKRLESLISKVKRIETCIFNIHVPPYGTGIDDAPKLGDNLQPQIGPKGVDMVPVGSYAVLNVIKKYQPLLSLHGHIHESKGITKVGRTICVNPGSEYSEGILRGALLTLEENSVRSYTLTSG